jgi:hypothetical protein
MKKWRILVNYYEYESGVIVKANNVVKISENSIVADGVEMEFDGDIEEPEILDNIVDCETKTNNNEGLFLIDAIIDTRPVNPLISKP